MTWCVMKVDCCQYARKYALCVVCVTFFLLVFCGCLPHSNEDSLGEKNTISFTIKPLCQTCSAFDVFIAISETFKEKSVFVVVVDKNDINNIAIPYRFTSKEHVSLFWKLPNGKELLLNENTVYYCEKNQIVRVNQITLDNSFVSLKKDSQIVISKLYSYHFCSCCGCSRPLAEPENTNFGTKSGCDCDK